jgi:hypothetical protein
MTTAVTLTRAPVRLPAVSYGPFRLAEAVPWLMFATAMRIVQGHIGLAGVLAAISSDVAIFLAFLLAARRMIELADGKTKLGRLSFREQLVMARKVLIPIVLLMFATCIAVYELGARWIALNLLFGVDGIAFDQYIWIGRAYSAFLAAVMLLMVLKAEGAGRTSLFTGLKELWQRAPCMFPAIVAVAAVNIVGLSTVQGLVRIVVYTFYRTSDSPHLVRNMVFFFFVLGFASLRLWVTLAILVFSLRESYRRSHATPAAAAGDI